MLVLRNGILVNRRHFRELLHCPAEESCPTIRSNRLERLVAADLLSGGYDHAGPAEEWFRRADSETEAGVNVSGRASVSST